MSGDGEKFPAFLAVKEMGVLFSSFPLGQVPISLPPTKGGMDEGEAISLSWGNEPLPYAYTV